MIKTRADLKRYINEDLQNSSSRNLLILWLKGSESYPIVLFIICLRHYEFYYNNKRKSPFFHIKKQFWRFFYRHAQLRFSLYIGVNVAGPGLKIVHPGFRIMAICKVGKNCTILPMVLVGKKKPNTDSVIIIGDNCYISAGVTILGPVTIGDNVTIGAGSVVTKDIPDNCVVAGVPARSIN